MPPAYAPPRPETLRWRLMRQWWRDVVFVHWQVEPDEVAHLMPRGVRPDLLDGVTHVGLVAFRMCDAGPGRGPAVPWLGTFGEVNVRLYSTDGERRGVVFCSLDADRRLVVTGARLAFGTPYQLARIAVPTPDAGPDTGHVPGDTVAYTVRRPRSRRGAAASSAVEVVVGDAIAEPSDLEHFVTARFGLHTTIAGRTGWVPNSHDPWPLHRADLSHLDDGPLGLVAAAGIDVTGRDPVSVLYSPGVHTEFGSPRLVGR